MYDIPELEKKWRKYKRNQIKKPIILTVATVAILGGIGALSYTYLYKGANAESKVVTNNNNVNSNTAAQTTAVQNSNTKSSDNSSAIVITKMSEQTEKKVATNSNSNPLVNVKPTAPATTNSNMVITTNSNEQEETIDLSKATIIKPNVPDDEIRVIGFDNQEKKDIQNKYSDILIPKQSTQDIQEREKIAELEERFQSSQDPQDSLKVARYYYEKGNYKKAENWAVNTNNIDGDLEDSWLIFAKSRAKQGFRTDAIKVLQSFYDETNSLKAKALLDDIRRGKPFK